MGENEKSVMQEIAKIREEIATIKVLLTSGYEKVDIKLEDMQGRIDKIEDNSKWIWRSMGGVLLVAFAKFIMSGGFKSFL